MSDLASWALRGLRGQGGAGNSDEQGTGDGEEGAAPPAGNTIGNAADEGPPLTAQEMRAQRLQRMQALQQDQQQAAAAADKKNEPQPMDIDESNGTSAPASAKKSPRATTKPAPRAPKATPEAASSPPAKEKKKRALIQNWL